MNPHASSDRGPGWRHLLRYARPYSLTLWLGAALTTIAAVLVLAQPMVVKAFLDRLVADEPVGPIVLFLTLLLGAATVAAACGYYLIERTAENIVFGVRKGIVEHILRLRMGILDRGSPGDLLSRVVSDSGQLRSATTSNLVDLVTGLLQLVGIVMLMAFLDLQLLAVVVVVIIGVGGAFIALMPRIKAANLRVQQALGGMGAVLERSLTAMRTIKANNAEHRESDAVTEAACEARRQGIRAARWVATAGVSTNLAVQVSFLVLLGFGGARVAGGDLDVSALVAFLLYLFYLTGPITQLTSSVSGLQVGMAALRRIEEVKELETEPLTRPDKRFQNTPARVISGASVSFRGVEFGYGPDAPAVFRGITFDIPAGGMTAIVGPSGSGKSTIFSLIERFYQPEAGSIRFDGRDIRNWPLTELREAIGYVEQDAPVLAGTLRDNLLLAAPNASTEELLESLTRTRLDSLVARLENGLDTRMGHQGVTLSGGERQRIAVARALLRSPRLLLLDEVTSHLDSINEQALREAIGGAAEVTTVVVIAHRISTVTGADQIIVLDDGRVRAVGTHEDLLASDELYRELSAYQFVTDGQSVAEWEGAADSSAAGR